MNEHTDKRVCLEPSTEQRLRLQLAQRDCQLNIEVENRLDAEWRFYQSEIQRYQLALQVAEPTKALVEEQRDQAKEQGKQAITRLIQLGEQIKLENGWSDQVHWDPVMLTFTAPAEAVPTSASVESTESKFSIQ